MKIFDALPSPRALSPFTTPTSSAIQAPNPSVKKPHLPIFDSPQIHITDTATLVDPIHCNIFMRAQNSFSVGWLEFYSHFEFKLQRSQFNGNCRGENTQKCLDRQRFSFFHFPTEKIEIGVWSWFVNEKRMLRVEWCEVKIKWPHHAPTLQNDGIFLSMDVWRWSIALWEW